MVEECNPEEFKQKPGVIVDASAETECCDDNTLRMVPDELREPPPAQETEKYEEGTVPTPSGIILSNHRRTANCTEEEQYGEISIVEDGTLTKTVYFSSVLTIKDDVLTYIARSNLEQAVATRWHSGTLSKDELRTLTGMTLVDAEALLEELRFAQEQLDTSAETIAQGNLNCYYMSHEARVCCSDASVLRPEQNPEAVYEAIVPAGQYQSSYSQEDADSKAESAAEAMLVCLYGNEAFIARCHERPLRPAEHMDPVPNDTIPIYPGRELRVGSVTVPANKFVSTTSLEDANRKAQDWGYAQLVCWYPSMEVTAECDDPDARNQGEDPATTERTEADIEKKTPGQHVRVPYGYYTSELSMDAATDEAEIFAESLLQCCFINDTLVFECQPEEVTVGTGETAVIQPKHEGNWRVVVSKGSFTSCTSKEEANLFAEQSAEGVLECSYCNLEIMPTCMPYWVAEGIHSGKIKFPLPRDVITDGENTVLVSQLPPEATIGAMAGAVCLPDAQTAQRLAEAIAVVPISGEGGWCTCYSAEVFVACQGSDPYGGILDSEGVGVSPDGQPYAFFTRTTSEQICLSETQSYPSPGQYIHFGPGVLSGNCGDALNEVGRTNGGSTSPDSLTAQVVELGKSMLRCMVENPPTEGTCGGQKRMASLCDGQWYYTRGKPEVSQLTNWSNSDANPIILPRGVVAMSIDEETHNFRTLDAEVGARVSELLNSLVICAYYNVQYSSPCNPPDPDTWTTGVGSCFECECRTNWRRANSGTVPARILVGDNPVEINNAAQALARSLGACDRDTIVSCDEVYPCKQKSYSSPHSSDGGGGGGIIPGYESSPVESSPVESSPVESSPVESSPVESSPVESSPGPSATSTPGPHIYSPYSSSGSPASTSPPPSSSPGSSGCDYQTCPHFSDGSCLGGMRDTAGIRTNKQLQELLDKEQAYLVDACNSIRAKIAEAKEKIAQLTNIVKAKKASS